MSNHANDLAKHLHPTAAAKAELEQSAAAKESAAKLMMAVAENQRRAAASLGVHCDAATVAQAADLPKAFAAKATFTDVPLPSMMDGLDKELQFEDPTVKSLMRDLFNLPAYTEQLFSFPVHDRYVRRTYFGRPGVDAGGHQQAFQSLGPKRYDPVFQLPPSNEPERVGYRINQAIDLYKDAYCYDRNHESVPVLAHPEVECKRRVEAWVAAKLHPVFSQQPVFSPQQPAFVPETLTKPVPRPPFGNQLYPPADEVVGGAPVTVTDSPLDLYPSSAPVAGFAPLVPPPWKSELLRTGAVVELHHWPYQN